MGEIATSERQITLFYSSKSKRAKQTLAYARAEGLPIHQIDITKAPPTGTQLAELSDRLGILVKDLVNQDHPAYRKKFGHLELSSDDWIKMIRHNPEIMKQPIALRGDITILIETPTDILRL
jgi:arsenate reductase